MPSLTTLIHQTANNAIATKINRLPFAKAPTRAPSARASAATRLPIQFTPQPTHKVIPQSDLRKYASRPPPNGRRSRNYPTTPRIPNGFVNPYPAKSSFKAHYTRTHNTLRFARPPSLTADYILKYAAGKEDAP